MIKKRFKGLTINVFCATRKLKTVCLSRATNYYNTKARSESAEICIACHDTTKGQLGHALNTVVRANFTEDY